MLTAYHARYFAYELTKRCSSDSVEKLASVLADVQVDLNPQRFDYTESGKHIAALEPLVGKKGWISCANFSVSALETEDILILVGYTLDKAWNRY